MKNHDLACLVNELRDIATAYHDHQSLREKIANTVKEYVNKEQAAQAEPVACLVGMKSSAFDTPTTKRAYTYKEQPGNVQAMKLGRACSEASKRQSGDWIDTGLLLLKTLQGEGFGVFDLGAEYPAPAVAQGDSIHVTDSMAYDFHSALDDSSLSQDDVKLIKKGLRAALANVTAVAVNERLLEALKKAQRELDACQKVLWLIEIDGYGVDPAYGSGARVALVEMGAAIAAAEAAKGGV